MKNKEHKEGKQGNWFARHKILTGILAFIVVVLIVAPGGNGNESSDTNSELEDTTSTSEQQSSEDSKPEVTRGISGGMYKIGEDMDAGEYVIVGSGYMQISSDSTGTFDSIIENDNYTNRTIIVVQDGQYLQFRGTAYTWDDAPESAAQDGVVPSGKYLVGRDFPAGEYKVSPTGGSGYIAITSSASGSLDAIVSNDNFSEDRYITIADGQYITINRAELNL